jgi:hypothetical protein
MSSLCGFYITVHGGGLSIIEQSLMLKRIKKTVAFNQVGLPSKTCPIDALTPAAQLSQPGTAKERPAMEPGVEVNWLIEEVKDGVARAAQGKMFDLLRETPGSPDRPKLGWVHQLAYMSREFIQALLARAALCGRRERSDYAFYPAFTEHVRAELRHPIELERWMRRFALVGGKLPWFCEAPMTSQTKRLLAYLWYIAEHAEPDEQVVVMNLVAEFMALAFYSAAVPCLEGLGMLWGRYWPVHRDADADHAMLGVSLLRVTAPSERGQYLRKSAGIALDLFDGALTSWADFAREFEQH